MNKKQQQQNERRSIPGIARRAVEYRTRKGLLERLPCQICGQGPGQAHHLDYGKPLDVMWLCRKHHDAWHRVFIAEYPPSIIRSPRTYSKINDSDVGEIKRLYDLKVNQNIIASQFGISRSSVSKIGLGKSWKTLNMIKQTKVGK